MYSYTPDRRLAVVSIVTDDDVQAARQGVSRQDMAAGSLLAYLLTLGIIDEDDCTDL